MSVCVCIYVRIHTGAFLLEEIPLWLRKCREPFKMDNMKKQITEAGNWDLYVIVVIMRYYLADTFQEIVKWTEPEAANIHHRLNRIFTIRNKLAHFDAVSEREFLRSDNLLCVSKPAGFLLLLGKESESLTASPAYALVVSTPPKNKMTSMSWQ